MKRIVVLSGAGISAESGIKTFRDADGLWEGHDVMEVASPEGFNKNPALVLDFYNQRRRQLKEVRPNLGHLSLVDLEDQYEVVIITQNVDDLHERAGSTAIIHLHGELTKMRSVNNDQKIFECSGDIEIGHLAEDGGQFRPHIVWFGEMVPMIEKAAEIVMGADIIIVVGTSMQVYPAAGLISYAPETSLVYYVDPKPTISHELSVRKNLRIIAEPATVGLPMIVDQLMKK